MSHTDDLEEYDAELEIALKKEYATVFPLFAYCVITQEATYLCNQLKLDCVPHSGYLLFELKMDDVWVWDRNRPTRIIPRAQIYTTADVTVEQLKETDSADFAAMLPQSVVDQVRASGFVELQPELEEPAEGAESVEGGAEAAGSSDDAEADAAG